MANSFFATEHDTMIDPAVIATIAASAATQKQPEGAVTLGQLVYGMALVFGVAGLIVWAFGAWICG